MTVDELIDELKRIKEEEGWKSTDESPANLGKGYVNAGRMPVKLRFGSTYVDLGAVDVKEFSSRGHMYRGILLTVE